MVHGGDYHHQANEHIVSMAMIETVEAFENIEAICATDGLTGLYVGPSDLAVSMGHNLALIAKSQMWMPQLARSGNGKETWSRWAFIAARLTI